MDEPGRDAALIAELEALLAVSHAQRRGLRELLAVVVERLETADSSRDHR